VIRLPAAASGRVVVVLLSLLALGGCGSDDDAGSEPEADEGDPVTADAGLDVEVEPIDAGFRITWTLANDGDSPLLVFDDFRGDEAPGEPVQGAFVTGGDDDGRGDGVVEVSRRLFPVPDDLEGAQQYGVNASELAPGATATATENVTVPFSYVPAASEGGGADLPDDPSELVFCVGVGDPDQVDASPLSGAPGHWFVPHTEANAAHQTLLCSDPHEL
jgi:hypothetical protein